MSKVKLNVRRIESERNRLGLSVQGFCKFCEIEYNDYLDILYNQEEAKMSVLLKIAKKTGCRIQCMFMRIIKKAPFPKEYLYLLYPKKRKRKLC